MFKMEHKASQAERVAGARAYIDEKMAVVANCGLPIQLPAGEEALLSEFLVHTLDEVFSTAQSMSERYAPMLSVDGQHLFLSSMLAMIGMQARHSIEVISESLRLSTEEEELVLGLSPELADVLRKLGVI